MKLSNKTYDRIKWITQYFLPALSTLFFMLGDTWNISCSDKIVGTITAVDAFLGIMLGISSANYNKCKKN